MAFLPAAGVVVARAGGLVNPLLRASHRVFHGPVGDGLIALAACGRQRPNASSAP